jgi:hypothetical protein
MPTFNDLESLSLVQAKINAVLGNVELIAAPAALVADTAFTYTSGQARTVSVGSRIMTVVGGHTYQVVAADAATFDLQTAGGVRVLLLPNGSGWYDFDGMAPTKDGTGDNLAKLQKLLDKMTFYTNEGWLGPSINFSAGVYAFSATINLKCQCQLYGVTTGFGALRSTRFVFPANTAGIIVNRHNTLGDQTVTSGSSADGSEIVGINLEGGRGDAFDETKSGIWFRARGYVSKCAIRSFAGHGVYAAAGYDGNPYLGNCNLFRIDRLFVQFCRGSGVHIQGTDANAGSCFHVDAKNNDRWCVYEDSFLGNYHYGHHSESNALGSYFGSNQSPFLGCYTEDGAGGNQDIDGPQIGSMITAANSGVGPKLGTEFANGPRGWRNDNGGFLGVIGDTRADLGTEDGTIVSGRHTNNSTPFRIGAYINSAVDAVIRWGSSSNNLISFGSSSTGRTFGRSAPVGEHVNIWTLFLGLNDSGRALTFSTAAPTTGTWARGDRVFNRDPAVGSPKGWICTVSGTPGTWVSEGNL